ncbi:tail protein X [Moraxella bovoculi]|uniref:Tail protein X n=1 Tax=Moraxella bovoculi TaxID=386891 RepID=A0AAC8T8M1_9GAMM|nr:tail protein X [Moraxella bovoculi]AKG08088.1 tail protein X [Moraxella bovoculi]AKG11190.1 tail protein X [Moraxella bovoculi]
MIRTIRSIQGDSLDSISYRYYGKSVVESLLSANPHLSNDVILPIGTVVVLPTLVQPTQSKQTIQLWS